MPNLLAFSKPNPSPSKAPAVKQMYVDLPVQPNSPPQALVSEQLLRNSFSNNVLTGYAVAVGFAIGISFLIGLLTYFVVQGEAENYFVAGKSLPLWIVAMTLGAQSVDSNSLLGNVDLSYRYHVR